jgi:2-keto-4-pentenoate hydratase/2-oxohepta-3-ene-1,7-dioic acid hydratase in catechol pathway
MRWIRYETNGQAAYGIVDGDMVTEVRGDPFTGYEKTATRRPLSSVKLLIPVEPRTFYAAGLNYAEHAIAAANKRGEVPKLPEAADIGYRANNALIAHGEAIVIPADATERVQYEAELVAVIGRKAKNLSESEALSCVLGWTIGNDMSERTWQTGDRTL